MKRFLTICLQLCCLAAIVAQETPAPAQTQPIVIMNATAHLGNGEVIEKSIVAFEDGKFTIIGDIAMGLGFVGYEVIDGNGKHLYPGF
ncbi:MAG: amidohydrolase, partial [Bacteroidota bacterium]